MGARLLFSNLWFSLFSKEQSVAVKSNFILMNDVFESSTIIPAVPSIVGKWGKISNTSEPHCIKNATDVIEIEKKCDSENTI